MFPVGNNVFQHAARHKWHEQPLCYAWHIREDRDGTAADMPSGGKQSSRLARGKGIRVSLGEGMGLILWECTRGGYGQ